MEVERRDVWEWRGESPHALVNQEDIQMDVRRSIQSRGLPLLPQDQEFPGAGMGHCMQSPHCSLAQESGPPPQSCGLLVAPQYLPRGKGWSCAVAAAPGAILQRPPTRHLYTGAPDIGTQWRIGLHICFPHLSKRSKAPVPEAPCWCPPGG